MDGRGLPLLSGPPPPVDSADSCRKCGKEFNVFLNRSRKCNHCGYSYCHSCTDYQALMPRTGHDAGYDSMNVCAYCIDFLTTTASGRGQLKAMSLGKLKKYADAYNIRIDRAVEKDDVIDGILAARTADGCLARENENFYRRYSVPSRAGPHRRGFFSRQNQNPSSPQPPPPQRPGQLPHNFPRPDLEPDVPPPQQYYAPPPGPPPRPQQQRQRPQHYSTPHPPPPPVPPRPDYYYHHSPPPMPGNHPSYHPTPHSPNPPPPPPPHMPQHPYPPSPPHVPHTSRPASTHPHPSPPHPNTRPTSQSPPHPRPTSAAPPPSATPPSLDELLNMTSEAIGSLSISALKAILFINHVNAGMILEKSDLVAKVKVLAADERKERERQRALEEQEEAERIERQRVLLEQIRTQREKEEGAHPHQHADGEQEEHNEDGGASSSDAHKDAEGSTGEPLTVPPPPPPKARGTAADLERTGLCVICQDEEANIAIVDCGHLAMCRGCSELIMGSSRECPLCRTRIVTEARLLRIFRT